MSIIYTPSGVMVDTDVYVDHDICERCGLYETQPDVCTGCEYRGQEDE